MRHRDDHAELYGTTLGGGGALCLVVAACACLLAGCSDGRSSFSPPHFVTFSPGQGTVYTIQATPRTNPRVRSDLDVGLGNQGWGLSVEGRFGLVFDSDTGRITQVEFHSLDNARETSTFFNIASFRVEGIDFSPNGTQAILRLGNFEMFKLLDFTDLAAPIPSAEFSPAEPISELLFPVDGRFGLFLYQNRFDQVEILDLATPVDPLIIYDLDLAEALVELQFLDLFPDAFIAIEGQSGRLRTYRFDDRSTVELERGSLDLPSATLFRMNQFHQSGRVAIGSDSGTAFIVDIENIDAPFLVSQFALAFAPGDFFLSVSPDDRFLAIGEKSSGRLLLYNIELPEVPLLVGSFNLGAALTDMQFSSRDDAREFRTSPSLLAITGGTITLVDLADPMRPILGPGAGFALGSFETFRMRDQLLITGLDGSGRVVTYDISDAERAVNVGTFDLGVGGGLSATAFIE